MYISSKTLFCEIQRQTRAQTRARFTYNEREAARTQDYRLFTLLAIQDGGRHARESG